MRPARLARIRVTRPRRLRPGRTGADERVGAHHPVPGAQTRSSRRWPPSPSVPPPASTPRACPGRRTPAAACTSLRKSAPILSRASCGASPVVLGAAPSLPAAARPRRPGRRNSAADSRRDHQASSSASAATGASGTVTRMVRCPGTSARGPAMSPACHARRRCVCTRPRAAPPGLQRPAASAAARRHDAPPAARQRGFELFPCFPAARGIRKTLSRYPAAGLTISNGAGTPGRSALSAGSGRSVRPAQAEERPR